ncbi:hypothetical protein [Thermomonospora cellulosilytica]|uniref:Uncharacterized protein n=1 Tax=Thermomonospora cellulosilytica TaxID=1411118 RepID=A0A7W3MU57_9ACTN|nr:hypothetical protein [Thermomonospora cellulosilytica]MBA9001939.1 hypothetical protein [Thermomonospora cellulosilytica]
MGGDDREPGRVETDRQVIAEQLGLPVDRITDALLERIARDPAVLHHIQACRHDPQMLDLLLTAKPAPATARPGFSTTALLARAGKAVTRWAASGFAQVPDDVFQQRRRACLSCEHLGPPPSGLPQWIARTTEEHSHCGLCGCYTIHKARLPTETCPDGRWPEYDDATKTSRPAPSR